MRRGGDDRGEGTRHGADPPLRADLGSSDMWPQSCSAYRSSCDTELNSDLMSLGDELGSVVSQRGPGI